MNRTGAPWRDPPPPTDAPPRWPPWPGTCSPGIGGGLRSGWSSRRATAVSCSAWTPRSRRSPRRTSCCPSLPLPRRLLLLDLTVRAAFRAGSATVDGSLRRNRPVTDGGSLDRHDPVVAHDPDIQVGNGLVGARGGHDHLSGDDVTGPHRCPEAQVELQEDAARAGQVLGHDRIENSCGEHRPAPRCRRSGYGRRSRRRSAAGFRSPEISVKSSMSRAVTSRERRADYPTCRTVVVMTVSLLPVVAMDASGDDSADERNRMPILGGPLPTHRPAGPRTYGGNSGWREIDPPGRAVPQHADP